ncbi:HD domain-containing protein [Alicyclobacillus sp. ALC3]|uniref:HD domain-containing protein n=1 Tax=Alicyclobacillus sp. ALC3 TaxID=2796143 RepID=UPI0023792C96|nr:HD domain-containing protein [Alicyclobacillus sp. ALC3]WDL97719.1 HD domain-containing protein [Alicyclobacillus sp. ALC3]
MQSSRLDDAIVFAAKAHKTQMRKGTDIPYITHPFAVAMLLQQAGCEENVVIAGLLHDTVEDTDVTLAGIRERYGERVAELVDAASEPNKAAPWKERKEHTIKFLADAPLDIKCLSCADKLHNIRSILSDLDKQGAGVWKRFNRGRDEQVWYYTELLQSFYRNLPADNDYFLFAAYRNAVVELRRIVHDELRAQEGIAPNTDANEVGPVPAWEDGEIAVRKFAHAFDADAVFGGQTVPMWLFEFGQRMFSETQSVPSTFTLADVRGCLFMLLEMWHGDEHSGAVEMSDESVAFVQALLPAIRERTRG